MHNNLTEEQLFAKLAHIHKDVLVHLEENRDIGLYKKIIFSWYYPSNERKNYAGSFWVVWGIIGHPSLYSNGNSSETVEVAVSDFNLIQLTEETRNELLGSDEWFDIHEMKIKKKQGK